MKPVPPGEVPLVDPNMTAIGLALSGAKKGLNATYNALRPDPTRSYGEVARALTEQGARRDARIHRSWMRWKERQGTAALTAPAGNATALAAAIAANGYASRNVQENAADAEPNADGSPAGKAEISESAIERAIKAEENGRQDK